jgi:hypothetical protein
MAERSEKMASGRLTRRRVLSALAGCGVAAGLWHLDARASGAGDDEIELAKVPAKIKEAANKAIPRAKWTGASKSEEDGIVTYQLDGEDAAKRYVGVELTADAKVNELQFEIAPARIPKVVTAALKKKMPRFQVISASEARREGKVVRYDFEGKRPRDKTEIEVSVSADGKTIEIDED